MPLDLKHPEYPGHPAVQLDWICDIHEVSNKMYPVPYSYWYGYLCVPNSLHEYSYRTGTRMYGTEHSCTIHPKLMGIPYPVWGLLQLPAEGFTGAKEGRGGGGGGGGACR